MKAETRRLEPPGARDELEDHANVARAFAYSLAIGVLLWFLVAAFIVWLV